MNIQKSINKIIRERERRRDKYQRIKKVLVLVTVLFLGIFIGSFFMQSNFSITGLVTGNLPDVGDSNWGTILNNYLLQEHNSEGGHVNITSNNWTNVSITSSQVTNFNNTVWELAGNGTLMLTTNWNSTNSSYRTLDNQTFEGDVNVTGIINATNYINPSGNRIGNWVLIETQTASNVAHVGFSLPSNYRVFKIFFSELIPINDDVELYLRFSNDGGISFRSGSDYAWGMDGYSSSGSTQPNSATADSEILVGANEAPNNGIGNGAGEHANGEITIYNSNNATLFTNIVSRDDWINGHIGTAFRSGKVNTAEINDAIGFNMSSGNIASGKFTLYGIAD